MRLSENRILAWIVLAVCIVGSIFGLGGASLAREYNDVRHVFYNGAQDRDAGHCMSAYLNAMFDSARTMALEAQIYLGADHEASVQILKAVSDERLESDEDFAVHCEIYRSLRYEMVDQLYNEMYRADLTDAQRKDFKIAYDDFQGSAKMIDKDPYMEMAADYNDICGQNFIAKIAGGIHGAETLCDTF